MKLESWSEGLHGDPTKIMASRGKVLPMKFWPQKYLVSPQLQEGQTCFLAQILPHLPGLPVCLDFLKSYSFSCPCWDLIMHQVKELERVGTMVLQKATSHALFPCLNPSIHSDFTWDPGVSQESWREIGHECDFNPLLKHRETPCGIGQRVLLFSSYSQTPFKASAKKLMEGFCTALGRQVGTLTT